MVYIITGGINQGKTTKLISLYQTLQKGDGFFCRKVFIGQNYAGQEIVRLSTEESRPIFLKKWFIHDGWDQEFCYDIYSFSRNGFNFARDIINEVIVNNINPIFLDELGPLELLGKGHDKSFGLLLENKKDIYVTIRETCLESLIAKFSLKKYEIISL